MDIKNLSCDYLKSVITAIKSLVLNFANESIMIFFFNLFFSESLTLSDGFFFQSRLFELWQFIARDVFTWCLQGGFESLTFPTFDSLNPSATAPHIFLCNHQNLRTSKDTFAHFLVILNLHHFRIVVKVFFQFRTLQTFSIKPQNKLKQQKITFFVYFYKIIQVKYYLKCNSHLRLVNLNVISMFYYDYASRYRNKSHQTYGNEKISRSRFSDKWTTFHCNPTTEKLKVVFQILKLIFKTIGYIGPVETSKLKIE